MAYTREEYALQAATANTTNKLLVDTAGTLSLETQPVPTRSLREKKQIIEMKATSTVIRDGAIGQVPAVDKLIEIHNEIENVT